MSSALSRRKLLALAAASPFFAPYVRAAEEAATGPRGVRQGRLKQSVMASVWGPLQLTLEERCEILSTLGFAGMDLPSEKDIPVLTDYGLAPALMTGTGTSFENGLVRRELHDQIEEATIAGIDMCARVGCKSLIALPGERRGMSSEEGLVNTVDILKRVAPYAEEKGVYVCMEITNSKVAADNRTDQMFNDVFWGFDVCKGTGSPNIRIVYDIYHVQIMNGDVVRTLRDNLDKVCHIHVAGVPTRGEIDDTQELNHPFIARAIADMGYEGFVAHEWRPAAGHNPVLSLATAFHIMEV
jgi:hydroxypyruvate isomerase